MSKSKKNTIDPENIIEDYGADAVRLFILSDSPPEKDVQWSEQGMNASYKFVQKLWIMHQRIKEKIFSSENNKNENDKISQFTNRLIVKVNNNLEKFNYNVIVANFYETYNFLIKELNNPLDKEKLLQNYTKILILMMPLIPHFASQCLEEIKNTDKLDWPKTDKKYLINEKIEYVVQINGKKRTTIDTSEDITEEMLIEEIKKNIKTKKFLENKNIIRSIFVKKRLINLIIQ